MTQPEDQARENIDRILTKSGWTVQDPGNVHLSKDDSHAEDIVQIVREEFGKGNDFAQKITYRTRELGVSGSYL